MFPLTDRLTDRLTDNWLWCVFAGGGGGLVVGGVSPVALRSKSRATVAISSHTHTGDL